MNLLKKLLPGLLPLFVFIAADEIWGTRVGLAIALAFGLAELGYYYIKERRIDRFILADTGLLIALGSVSIILDNDIFFKIKPALIELILLGLVGYSLWGKTNLVLQMTKRYTGEININDSGEKLMRLNMLAMFWITAGHIVLIVISARYMSNEAWVFISGVLFYILFGLWFGAVWLSTFLKNRRYKNEEIFPIVDEDGKVVGTAPRSVCHDGKSMLLHPVVHLHLFNSSGRLYLQKRSQNKDIQPGKWDTAVGGHIAPGEDVEAALRREASEELGLTDFEPRFAHKYVWESSRERELVFSFITVKDVTPAINPDEIEEGRFWSIEEIAGKVGKEVFTPNFEKEFSLIRTRKK